jgi:hypothetical protein
VLFAFDELRRTLRLDPHLVCIGGADPIAIGGVENVQVSALARLDHWR